MKELAGVARNRMIAIPDKQGPEAQAEVVLTVSEAAWKQKGRKLVRTRETTDLRFAASAKALWLLAHELAVYARELEKLDKRAKMMEPEGE